MYCSLVCYQMFYSSSSSSIGTTAHCGIWSVEQCPYIFSYLPPNLSIFSLPALEDLFLFPHSIFSWVFSFFSSLPVVEWRYFCASYPPPFSLGDLTSLPFALLSIVVYFLLCSFLLFLDSSDFSIPHFHIYQMFYYHHEIRNFKWFLQWNSACFFTVKTSRSFTDPNDDVTIINGRCVLFCKSLINSCILPHVCYTD